MVSRVAKVAGSAILGIGATALVFGLLADPTYPTAQIKPEISKDAGRAFENEETARLALARFPLPLAGEAEGEEHDRLMARVQIELARHGLDPGPADGGETPKTRDAIAAYQKQMGLEVTGEASRNLLDHLSLTQPLRQASSSKSNGAMLKLVASVQKRLSRLGYPAGAPSGVVTGKTRNAIAKFERDIGLPVTGEVSTRLVQRLNTFDSAPLL